MKCLLVMMIFQILFATGDKTKMKTTGFLERMTTIADCQVTLYSIDGKNWSTNRSDLEQYEKRRKQAIKVAQELMNRVWLSTDEN